MLPDPDSAIWSLTMHASVELAILSAPTMLTVAVVIVIYASGLCRGKKGTL